jgi:hypothetical protein
MYDLGIWSTRCSLLQFPEGPLLPPHGKSLPPPPRSRIPPLPKGPPPSLLINIVRPLINSLPTSPIGDDFPLWSWYSFAVRMIHGILRLCFLSK